MYNEVRNSSRTTDNSISLTWHLNLPPLPPT